MAKLHYDCTDCIGYCCSIYERVDVNKTDLKRLAKYFGVTEEVAEKRYTRSLDGVRSLKRVSDRIFERTCMFLNQETRLCTIYEGRPKACREWPTHSGNRCVYYDILTFERRQQGDPDYLPVVEIKVLVEDEK